MHPKPAEPFNKLNTTNAAHTRPLRTAHPHRATRTRRRIAPTGARLGTHNRHRPLRPRRVARKNVQANPLKTGCSRDLLSQRLRRLLCQLKPDQRHTSNWVRFPPLLHKHQQLHPLVLILLPFKSQKQLLQSVADRLGVRIKLP